MIVRLEPRGEAKSTAELYLSGKGTVPSQTPPFVSVQLLSVSVFNTFFTLPPFPQKLN